jgi:hypothetical protein
MCCLSCATKISKSDLFAETAVRKGCFSISVSCQYRYDVMDELLLLTFTVSDFFCETSEYDSTIFCINVKLLSLGSKVLDEFLQMT